MTRKSPKPGNPYKLLYWMGAGMLLLLLGVVLLAVKMRGHTYVPPDPERYMVWLYDGADKAGPAGVAMVEESRSTRALHAVTFPAPETARKAFAQAPRKAQAEMAALAGRAVHHRLFLTHAVLATLVDAAGGVTVDGHKLDGAGAVAYVKAGAARRSADVLLALADQVQRHGINLSLSQGLSLARQVDTDLDLTALPDLFARWTAYPSPRVETPVAVETAALDRLLMPDPAGATAKR